MNSFMILILFVFPSIKPRLQCDNDDQYQWYVIGIYSACYNETNRTELHHLAEALDKSIKFMWEHGIYDRLNYKYISIDVCDDFNNLPKIVESIYLNESLYYLTWSEKLNKSYSLSSVIAIYAEGPAEMMNYLDASFHDDIRFTGRDVSYNSSFDYEQYNMYATNLHYIITHRLKLEHLVIFKVQPFMMNPLFEILKYKALQSKLCIHWKEIDKSWNINQENHFSPRWFKENKPAVLTMGDRYGQVLIAKQLGILMEKENFTIPILVEGFESSMRYGLYTPENFDCFKNINSSIITIDSDLFFILELYSRNWRNSQMFKSLYLHINKTTHVGQRYSLQLTLSHSWLFNFQQFDKCGCSINYECIRNTIRERAFNLNLWKSIRNLLKWHSAHVILSDTRIPLNQTSRGCRKSTIREERYGYVLMRDRHHDANQCTYNQNNTVNFLCWQGIPEVETSHCSALNCAPGFYRSYEKIEHGFSWICVRCQKNHHKSDFGNHLCYPCEGRLSIDNGERTACVDPYTNIFVSYQSKEFYIIGVISMVGSLTAILTLIIFIIKRNTPIVTTSNFKVSSLHISIQAVTMITAPILYFMNHNCVSKPLVLTTLYTFDIGIVFIKSQKLLQAFLCKVKLTAEEDKRTVMAQILTVVIFLVSVNAVFFVCLYQQQVTILEFEDPQGMTREYACNTYFHSNAIMIAIAVIQLMCTIQAFRGRHLPSVMNDGVVLMFTTIILTASFVVCFIIVPFQRPTEKEISQCMAILVNTMVITFLMYGLKAYRILFHPEQNTRVYFRNQCLTEMRQDVNQRIEMR
ncbi:uncharacterized protein [Clytia hemisphaerica]|uniref:uncharacterized protein n=1 Tax=Clytia hemisphaerica TaxID=252671 RepID=UPI0034D4C0A1